VRPSPDGARGLAVGAQAPPSRVLAGARGRAEAPQAVASAGVPRWAAPARESPVWRARGDAPVMETAHRAQEPGAELSPPVRCPAVEVAW
jgi:hypothetical protein